MASHDLPPIPDTSRSPFTRNLRTLADRLDPDLPQRPFQPAAWARFLRDSADEIDDHEAALAAENVALRKQIAVLLAVEAIETE